MKHTLSYNRQLFNVKAIAAAGLAPSAIPEGQFGIVDSSTNLTVLPADFANLPDKVRFISKLNGKVYYSFDTIEKATIANQQAKTYQAGVVDIWKGTVRTSCDKMKSALVNIHINEDDLIRRDGLTWTHVDKVIEVAPKEFECHCDCIGKTVYENHVMTKLLYEKINAENSDYYSASVELSDGTPLADSAAIQAHIDANKAVNTDDDETNDTLFMVLVITAKDVLPNPQYKDLEINYIYPRGTKLDVSAVTNDDEGLPFNNTQEMVYEVGAGYDVRAEEFECMSNYTNLNYFPQLSDGIATKNLIYQFENGKNYDVLTFEFDTPKVERSGAADNKNFIVSLYSENGSGTIHADLVSMFNA